MGSDPIENIFMKELQIMGSAFVKKPEETVGGNISMGGNWYGMIIDSQRSWRLTPIRLVYSNLSIQVNQWIFFMHNYQYAWNIINI